MICIPIKSGVEEALIVILGPDNLGRMKEGDPAEINVRQLKVRSPMIRLAYEEDQSKVTPFIQRGDVNGLIKYLQRGWKFRPEKGDHDRGPESIKDSQ